MTFARLSTANVYYGPYDKLQERPPPTLQIMIGSVIATHYGKYGKLLEGPEDQPILNNDEITGDVRDAKKAEDAKDAGKVKDKGDGGDTRDAGEAGNAKDVGDPGDVGDKEAGRGNDETVNRRDQEDGNHKLSYSGDQKAGKPEDVKMGNNGVGNGGNQDNQCAIIEDTIDLELDARVTDAVNPTNRALANVLAHLFSPLSSWSNLPPGVTAVCSSQFHNNQFKFFPFISLLTSLQGLTKFLMNRVIVWLAPLALFLYCSGAKRFVAAIIRAF